MTACGFSVESGRIILCHSNSHHVPQTSLQLSYRGICTKVLNLFNYCHNASYTTSQSLVPPSWSHHFWSSLMVTCRWHVSSDHSPFLPFSHCPNDTLLCSSERRGEVDQKKSSLPYSQCFICTSILLLCQIESCTSLMARDFITPA